MNIDPVHRCVMHVGGNYKETDVALERFIHNWMYVPHRLQEMIMLENDDSSFTLEDTLYLCEKLGIPWSLIIIIIWPTTIMIIGRRTGRG